MISINLDEIKAAHEALMKEIDEICKDKMKLLGNSAAFHASQTTSFKGTSLKNSVQYAPKNTKYTLGIRVFTNKSHASFLEEGTKPHVIQARKARALRFVKDGNVVFTKSVNHPGTKPTFWFSKATTKAEHQVLPELTNDLERIAQKF